MIIVLRNDPKGLPKVSAKLDAEGLPKLLRAMDETKSVRLDLKLPRSKARLAKSLVEPMQLCGVKLAFDDDRANSDLHQGCRSQRHNRSCRRRHCRSCSDGCDSCPYIRTTAAAALFRRSSISVLYRRSGLGRDPLRRTHRRSAL